MENNELYHWGIKGQRWGMRRYQNPDGSLTPSGKMRYKKSSQSRTENDKQAAENKPKPKTISEMSNDELQAYITRKSAEKNAYELRKSIADLNPEKVSAGKKFVKTVWKGVVAPAMINAGKTFLTAAFTNMLNSTFGDIKNKKDEKKDKKSENKAESKSAK